MTPLDLIVPFYKDAALADALFGSLAAIEDELAAGLCSILAIDDSPGDAALQSSLRRAAERFRIPFEIAVNPRNLGFVGSANIGLRRAVERGHHALLLNSDTLVFPGAIAEMRRVAELDPMIGFVNPRSNNASILSLPQQEEYRDPDPAAAHALYARLAPLLPDFQFTPTAVGFCLLIRREVLEEFGLLDECYSPGYSEENDLVMRANRCGYRAALANRAFVYHAGGGSFAAPESEALERRNERVLGQRYPEYLPAVAHYCSSPNYRFERLLGALLPGRPAVAFDFSSFEARHNGTFDAGRRILEGAAREWPYRIHVIVSPVARRFHRLDDIPGLSFEPLDTERVFAAAFRFGQPFSLEHISRMASTALVNVYAMLDPIALDCLYLREPDLEALWAAVFAHADGVVYISDFGADEFRRRFRLRDGLRELVCLLSLDPADYAPETAATAGEHLLVIGNHFAHKHMAPTVRAIKEALPDLPIVALGLPTEAVPGVRCSPSGELHEAEVRELFRKARAIVFPSLYEGFGLPIMEGLARRKPVLARDIPAAREIRARANAGDNLILYSSTGDLVRRLRTGIPEWRETAGCTGGEGWDAVTRKLGAFIGGLVEAPSFDRVLLPRLEHIFALERMIGGDVARLRDRETRIADLRNSLSWRLTAPLRAAGSLWLRLTGGGAR
ncbi:MAG TPA: glycosyltransferase [Bryobacteraceae bacterium]|nr:glycosyltransferase [Bryobacteraceae bacterium]